MMPRMSWSMRFAARSTSTPLMSGILMSEISRSTGSRSSAVDGRLAVLGEQHLVAFAPQHDRQQLAHRPLVVDDENAGRRGDRRAPRERRLGPGSCRDHRARRQAHRHRRARPRLRADLNLAVVVGHDPVDDGQARDRCPSRSCRETAERAPSSSSGGMPMPSSCTVMTTPSDAVPPTP